MNARVCTRTHICTHRQAHMHTQARTHAHAGRHAHTHAHTFTYAQRQIRNTHRERRLEVRGRRQPAGCQLSEGGIQPQSLGSPPGPAPLRVCTKSKVRTRSCDPVGVRVSCRVKGASGSGKADLQGHGSCSRSDTATTRKLTPLSPVALALGEMECDPRAGRL